MGKRDQIIAGATRSFAAQGFRGIGVDAALAPSGASTRTHSPHFGARDGLVLAVIERRHRAFMDRLTATVDAGIAGLFDALPAWMGPFEAHGCMLLRAHGAYAGSHLDIAACVRRQKDAVLGACDARLAQAPGRPDAALALQVWMLSEGATAAASFKGAWVVGPATEAAEALLSRARAQ